MQWLKRKCPSCDSHNVRKSRHRLKKHSLRHVFSVWLRCNDCNVRFQGTDWGNAGKLAAPAVALLGLVVFLSFSAPPDTGANLDRGSSLPATSVIETDQFVLPQSSGLPLTDQALREAADRGDSDAQYRLGLELLLRYRGQGDRGALADAIARLRSAAEQDHPRAQLALGTLHMEGQGVIQDYVAAADWYRRAARNGEPEAMLRIGQMYTSGRGTSADLMQAYVWLNLAVARGERRAEFTRDRVHSMLSREEIAEAQGRARQMDGEIPAAVNSVGSEPGTR